MAGRTAGWRDARRDGRTRAIVQAAAHAERAVAYLHQLANPEEVKEAA